MCGQVRIPGGNREKAVYEAGGWAALCPTLVETPGRWRCQAREHLPRKVTGGKLSQPEISGELQPESYMADFSRLQRPHPTHTGSFRGPHSTYTQTFRGLHPTDMTQKPNTEQWDLMFTPLSFSFTLVPSLFHACNPFRNGSDQPMAIPSLRADDNLRFDLHRPSQSQP